MSSLNIRDKASWLDKRSKHVFFRSIIPVVFLAIREGWVVKIQLSLYPIYYTDDTFRPLWQIRICHYHKIQPLRKRQCSRHRRTNAPEKLGISLAFHLARNKSHPVFQLTWNVILIHTLYNLMLLCKTKVQLIYISPLYSR